MSSILYVHPLSKILMHVSDIVVKQTITLVIKGVLNIINGYFNELNKVAREIINLGLSDEEESEELKSSLCGPAIASASEKYCKEITNIQVNKFGNNMSSALLDIFICFPAAIKSKRKIQFSGSFYTFDH